MTKLRVITRSDLVKNLVLTPKRTWGRKVREAALAVAIERRYSKDEILSAYLNGIYLGQHGGFAVYGIGAAARSFFGIGSRRCKMTSSRKSSGNRGKRIARAAPRVGAASRNARASISTGFHDRPDAALEASAHLWRSRAHG